MGAMKVGNSVCLITGSARGLGKAFAVRLLTEGASVCISDIKQEVGEATVEELRATFGQTRVTFVLCDVTQPDQLKRLFDECELFFNVKCIDLLVNNAGVNTMSGWRKCMEVNIIGVMAGTEIALERMKNHSKGGTIVNVASMAGVTTGAGASTSASGFSEDILPYYVSKHGVVQMTRTLSSNLPESGIELKVICPSFVDTEIVSSMPEETKKNINKFLEPMGGFLTCEQVAESFHTLLTACPQGSVMGVVKSLPSFIIPDTQKTQVKGLGIMAAIIGKVTGARTIMPGAYKTFAILVFCFLLLLLIGLQILLVFLFRM